MKSTFLGVLLAAFLLAAVSFVSIYLGLTLGYAGFIGVILLLIVAMVIRTMEDVRTYPDLVCHLSEDAKSVQVKNRGTARAVAIHVALVPLNIEKDIPLLEPDETITINLPQMVAEVKTVVTYKNEQGSEFSQSFPLFAFGSGDEDLLKPTFPLFGWK